MRLFNFYFSVNNAGTTGSLVLKPYGVLADYDGMSIKLIGKLEINQFDRLIDINDDQLTLILNSQAYDGISDESDNLNWINYIGSSKILRGKKYMQIKNLNIYRVHLIDKNVDVQKDGLEWPTVTTATSINRRKFPRLLELPLNNLQTLAL